MTTTTAPPPGVFAPAAARNPSRAARNVELARRHRSGAPARAELDRLRRAGVTRGLYVERLRREATDAGAELVRVNGGLVQRVIAAYFGIDSRHPEYEDAFHCGVIGLLDAADAYDPSRGAAFSSFAAPRIRSAVQAGWLANSTAIRLNGYARGAATGRLKGRNATAATAKSARSCLAAMRSLGEPIRGRRDDRDYSRFGDTIPAPDRGHAAAVADADAAGEAARTVAALLGGLRPREAEAVRLRFGIGGGGPMTLGEVGGRMGVCKERSRQLISAGLFKMRRQIGSAETTIR